MLLLVQEQERNGLPSCKNKKNHELGVGCPIERVCEGVILCKAEVLEVWIIVELGGVAREDRIEANAMR